MGRRGGGGRREETNMFSRNPEVVVPATALLGAVSPFLPWFLGRASSEVAFDWWFIFLILI